MQSSSALLKCVAKAVVKHAGNAIGFGVAGDLLVDVAPEIVADVWKAWSADQDTADRRQELWQMAQSTPDEIRREAQAITQDVAADQTAEAVQAVEDFIDTRTLAAEVVNVTVEVEDGVTDIRVVVASSGFTPTVTAMAKYVAEELGTPIDLSLQVVETETDRAKVTEP